jgi:hypothetical protein
MARLAGQRPSATSTPQALISVKIDSLFVSLNRPSISVNLPSAYENDELEQPSWYARKRVTAGFITEVPSRN